MSEVQLNKFPANKYEALTMLYLQNRDLKNKTPEDLLDLYYETYQRIYEHKRNSDRSGVKTFK